jgi:hypothetical protein
MDAAAFARLLRVMTPERFAVVGGCVLWPEFDAPSEIAVQEALQRLRESYAAFTQPAALDARARAAYEHDFNRRFIVRDLDGIDGETWTPVDLVTCAEHWAAVLRDALQRQLPGRAFRVEVVGGEGADEEPLEVCVTFSQAE